MLAVPEIRLERSEIDELFPFNFIIDPETRIIHAGPTLRRLLPEVDSGAMLDQVFSIKLPTVTADFEDIRKRSTRLFKLYARSLDRLALKGQMVHLPQAERLMFLGSPWITSNEDIFALGLSLKDFALHDSAPDLVIQTYGLHKSLEDAQELAERLGSLNKQLEHRVAERTQQLASANEMLRNTNQDLRSEIAERRQAEEQLRMSEESLNMAQEISSIGSWDWNIQNGTQSWTSQTYANLGVKLGEITPTYETFKKCIHPDGRRLVEKAVENALKGDDSYSVEVRMINPDGAEWIMHAQGHVYRDDEGNPIRIVGTQQDITEKRQMEEALRRSQKMDALGQLTGGIAHDFNNILGIILGNLSLLKHEVSNEGKAPGRLDTIEKTAQRAAGLTKQLLGITRKKGVDVDSADISVLIRNMADLISRSVTPEVEVAERLSDDLWLTEIDRNDFGDTLLNLVLNARDAMPNGGRLTIETRNRVLDATYCARNPEARPGEYVQLSLTDTGTGISDEDREHIFEPFFTTKPVGKGTGLGLSMVFGFINRSHGHIDVHSQPSIGTTFDLFLPRVDEKEQLRKPGNNADDHLEKAERGNERILVVDDEPELLELALDFLQSQGYRVLTAGNGRQALELLENNPDISLLFSDVIMPGGISGFDLAQRAKAIHPDLKVLLTSGHTKKAGDHMREEFELLVKPYSLEALSHQVRSLLGESKTDNTEKLSDST